MGFSSLESDDDLIQVLNSRDENNLFNQCLINSCSEYIDVNNLSDAYNAVNDEGSGNYETDAETCYIDCIEQNLLVDNELQVFYEEYTVCLLYTSDAADE